MSHWFHRNALKATAPVGFDLKGVLSVPGTSKIASNLRLCRQELLELMTDPSVPMDKMEEVFNNYCSLIHGFLMSQSGKTEDAQKSKLRPIIRFKWSMSVQAGTQPTEISDSWYEVLSMCLNMALWYCKHAAKLASGDEVSENDAKEIHTGLRKAAGIFEYVTEKKSEVKDLMNLDTGTDFDGRVLDAYVNQSRGEAQEIVVARAIERKLSPGIISPLACSTAGFFRKAEQALSGLPPNLFDKWRKYCQLKMEFYMSYACAFRGEAILAEDKCGEAVRICTEAVKHYEKCCSLCKEYAKTKGPKGGKSARPENHLFFRKLLPIINRHLEKAERENGMIYHQTVPTEMPALDETVQYGMVESVPFKMADPHADWQPHIYEAFDVTKAEDVNFKKAAKSDKDLPEVKEKPVYETDKDPNNSSGCTIS